MHSQETQRPRNRKKRGELVTSGTKYEDYNIEDEDLIILFEKYYENILKVFQHYSSFMEPLNNSRLHAFKFIKLLREAGLLQVSFVSQLFYNWIKWNNYPENSFKILQGLLPAPGGPSLSVADADIIVSSLTGPKQVREVNDKKLNFDQEVETPYIGEINYLYKDNPLKLASQGRLEMTAFLKSIELMSKKLYPDEALAQAAAQIIEKHILKLEQEIKQVQKEQGSKPLKMLVDLLQDMEAVNSFSINREN